MSDGIPTLKVFKALEELFDSSEKDADALANYHTIRECLLEKRNPKIIRSSVPLILQTMDGSGQYVYKQREVETEV